ncbi:MAG: LysR family transcriptional regulator [Paucibacter sp.]|nr:LysR family transcriptional regulator [Roseateles sp.]
MDLKRLGHLLLLAEERHFGRAAERAFLSQPAFSRSIQSIEGDLGLRLFDRETADVCPTRAGDFVIERARRLLFEARSVERDIALYKDASLGDLAFGTGPFPAAALLHRVMPELRETYPDARFRIEVLNWELLYERLLKEDIEFFVAELRDLPADPRIDAMPLGRLQAGIFVRAQHPFAGRRCTLQELWPLGLATTKLPSSVMNELGRLLGIPQGTSLRQTIQSDDYSLLKTLVLSTDTAVAVPEAVVTAELATGQLVRLQVENLQSDYAQPAVVSLAHRTLSPMAQRVIRIFQDLIRSEACVQAPMTATPS